MDKKPSDYILEPIYKAVQPVTLQADYEFEPLDSDLIRALTVYDSERLYNAILRCPSEVRDKLEGVLYAVAQEHNAQYPEI